MSLASRPATAVWFQHVPQIWGGFPELVPADADVDAAVEAFSRRAAEHLGGRSESELRKIQA